MAPLSARIRIILDLPKAAHLPIASLRPPWKGAACDRKPPRLPIGECAQVFAIARSRALNARYQACAFLPPPPELHLLCSRHQIVKQIGQSHVHSPRQKHHHLETHDGGSRRQTAPRLRLRRDERVRSVPAARRFPQRPAGRLPRRLSLASASRHRDHHLCAGRQRRARRQPRQSRQSRSRRRAMDDRRARHPSSGNAARRRQGPHARISALGQSAVVAEDDGAALSGREGRGDSGNRRG